MKMLLAIGCALFAAGWTLCAQEKDEVNAPEDSEKPKKTDIKELMDLPAFTNVTEMVMVKISPAMWAGKFEVTQSQYQKVAGSNPSKSGGGQNPVDSVSWSEAQKFCRKLNDAERKEEMLPEGYEYRLPTESEWESLVGGASLQDAVTSERNSRTGTAAAGSFGANKLGLHDVRGNVWEWCDDAGDRAFHVLRGGAWDTSYEPNLRLEFKWFSDGSDDKKPNFGFRVVMVPAGK